MEELRLDSVNVEDLDRFKGLGSFDSKIHIKDREDEETIRKTKSLQIPTQFYDSNYKPAPLTGRAGKESPLIEALDLAGPITKESSQSEALDLADPITKESSPMEALDLADPITKESSPMEALDVEGPISDEPFLSPKEQLLAMDPEILREIDKMLDTPPEEPNYLIRVQAVIGKILAQFIRIAEKERVQKEEQKIKYNKATREWGEYQREIGDRGLNFTWIALGIMVAQFALPQGDREIASFLAKEGCTNLSNMFNTDTQSKQKMVDAVGQLAYSEITAMMNKGASDSNKQEFINLLDKIYDSLKRAAQNG